MNISPQKASAAHGVLLMGLFSFAAFYIAQFPIMRSLQLSPLIIGIVLGMLYANSLRNHLPETWVPGIKLCTKQILRWGIILYGFRLTFQQVFEIGLSAVATDSIIVCGTLSIGILAGKMLKLDSDTTLMVSTGASICGAAAVLGAEPVVKCSSSKTAVAVSTVVVFGTIAMFLYPALCRSGLLSLTDQQMAVYTGATLHEVAHVVGAGGALDPDGTLHIADMATITKMIRVMMLAPVLVIMGFVLYRVRTGATDGTTKIAIPWFAFGFVAVIAINSLLQSLPIPHASLATFTSAVESIDTFMLTMAMTALGAETSIDKFRAAGAKPFLLAFILFIWLVVGGYFIAKFIV